MDPGGQFSGTSSSAGGVGVAVSVGCGVASTVGVELFTNTAQDAPVFQAGEEWAYLI